MVGLVGGLVDSSIGELVVLWNDGLVVWLNGAFAYRWIGGWLDLGIIGLVDEWIGGVVDWRLGGLVDLWIGRFVDW